MKRKILSLLLAAAMLMSLMAGLSGCGFGNQSKTPGTQKAETFTDVYKRQQSMPG